MPYQGNVENNPDKVISMFIYLPLSGDEAGIGALIAQLIDAVMQINLPTNEMDLQFPKFTMQSEYNLKDVSWLSAIKVSDYVCYLFL